MLRRPALRLWVHIGLRPGRGVPSARRRQHVSAQTNWSLGFAALWPDAPRSLANGAVAAVGLPLHLGFALAPAAERR
jgi:hypothetical protein